LKLFYSAASPFVRKVMIVLHETGQLEDVTIEPTMTSPLTASEALKTRNPLAKLPALVRDDGPTLFDSRVICAWLDERAGGKLYGKGARSWEIRTLEALADGILDAAVLMTYELRHRPEDMRSTDWLEGQWGKIDRACSALDAQWMGHLAGPLDMGHIAVASALGYLDFRHGARDWRAGRAALAGWYKDIESRPSFAATRPPEAA